MQIINNIKHHPYMASFFALLSALLKFAIESLAVDGIAYILLCLMMAIDAYTGVRLAKLENTYSYKVLKEKTVKKVSGCLIILMGTWIFTMMMFVFNYIAGEHGINYYYLNIPMLTTLLFYAGVEFLSIKDKVKTIYGVIAPASVVDRVGNFVNSGGGEVEKLLNNN